MRTRVATLRCLLKEDQHEDLRDFACGFATVALSGAAYAGPDKDESGHGRWRGGYGYDRYYDRYGYGDDRKVKFRTPDGCEKERKWKKGQYEE